MIPYQRVASLLFGQPLLASPHAAEIVSAAFLKQARSKGGGGSDERDADTMTYLPPERGADGTVTATKPKASRFMGQVERLQLDSGEAIYAPFPITADGVAIITVDGELVNRGSWIGASSGLVSYEGVEHQLEVARRSERIKGVVLDINTPGGEATGAFELAAAVRAVSDVKPVIALANGLAASAGYAMATGAREIWLTPSAHVGSIGVVMLHLDYAKALEDEGVRPTLIFKGAHKVDGHPFGPLSDDVRADFEAQLESTYAMFCDCVAAGRGGKLTAKAARATEARMYQGKAAVAAGLADKVGTLRQAVAAVAQSAKSRPAVKGASPAGPTTSTTSSTGASKMDITEGQQPIVPAAAAEPAAPPAIDRGAAVQEGRAAAMADMKAILEAPEAKGKQGLAMTLAMQGVAPDLAKTILSAAAAELPSLAERMAADPPANLGGPTPAPASAAKAGLAAAVQAMIKA